MENQRAKSCGTCKHFEASTEWRRGWCRNTLLYAPSQSHPVQSEGIDCSRGAHDFWAPDPKLSSTPQHMAGQQSVKLPNIENPLKLFAPAAAGPTLATAGPTGGNMMFASTGSGGGGYDDDDAYYDDDYGFDDEPEEPQRPQSNRTRRSAATADTTGGRSRSASYQPEERYWTDYLRIALPVIGIVLMLGLLWIWASQLLGGDSDNKDTTNNETIGLVSTATSDPNAVIATNSASSPAANNSTNAGEIPISGQTTTQPTNPPADLTATETPKTGGDNASGTEEASSGDSTSTDGAFQVDEYVTVTEDDVNIRSEASTSADIVRTAPKDELFIIRSGPEEADGYTWWEVVSDADGDSGWIVEDFLQAADQP